MVPGAKSGTPTNRPLVRVRNFWPRRDSRSRAELRTRTNRGQGASGTRTNRVGGVGDTHPPGPPTQPAESVTL